jgi:uncharacterized protein (TIGR00369 family)
VTLTRREAVAAFVPRSPLAALLGIELIAVGDDHAELRMPYRPELATMEDTVHGGAIAALLDTAGMAAAWADDTEPERLGGATVSLSIAYVQAARGCDLSAVGRVIRRGRGLCFVEVKVLKDDAVFATGLLIHRYA